MNSKGTIFIVRGLPGSGRTTAIDRVRESIPSLIFVDADPPVSGVEFSEPRAHHASIQRAAADIRDLVQHNVEHIAVETCAPRAEDVNILVDAGRKAGYSIEELDPAGQSPKDVIYCFEKSSHEPDPDFLTELVAKWEPFELAPRDPQYDVDRANRGAAWNMFSKAMAADSYAAARSLMDEVYEKYPSEASALQLDSGPSWGRIPDERKPIFPLARICDFWSEIELSVSNIGEEFRPKLGLPEPQAPSQGVSL